MAPSVFVVVGELSETLVVTFTHYLHQLALLIRLPNAFTVISNVCAAYIIGAQGAVEWQGFISLLIAGLSFYHAGMILNDCLDIKEDRQFQPHRPLAAGTISALVAWLLALYLFAFGLVILFSFAVQTFIYGVLLLICIVAYNLASRQMYFACLLMGLCRCLLWMVVLSAVNAVEQQAHYAVLVGAYVMALTFLSRDENLAQNSLLPGVSASILTLGCGFFLAMQFYNNVGFGVNHAVLLVLLGIAFFKLMQLYKNYTPQAVRATVMFFILGLIPLDATLLFISGYPVAAIAVLLLIIPGRMLAKFLYVS
jgi:4-hydroxybenzoate polyprenyltransferase